MNSIMDDLIKIRGQLLAAAIFELTNGDIIVSSFKEEENNIIVFVNPMRMEIIENEKNELGVRLEPYIHSKLVFSTNFVLNKDKVFASFTPSDFIFQYYSQKIMNIGQPITSNKTKKMKPKANNEVESTSNNVIHVDFKDRKSNTKNSLVNIYKEEDVYIVDDGPPESA